MGPQPDASVPPAGFVPTDDDPPPPAADPRAERDSPRVGPATETAFILFERTEPRNPGEFAPPLVPGAPSAPLVIPAELPSELEPIPAPFGPLPAAVFPGGVPLAGVLPVDVTGAGELLARLTDLAADPDGGAALERGAWVTAAVLVAGGALYAWFGLRSRKRRGFAASGFAGHGSTWRANDGR